MVSNIRKVKHMLLVEKNHMSLVEDISGKDKRSKNTLIRESVVKTIKSPQSPSSFSLHTHTKDSER